MFHEILSIQVNHKYKSCVREVNAMIDHDEITLALKAMIRYGLALNTNCCWEIPQLFQHLQDIIQRYSMEFAGSEIQ